MSFMTVEEDEHEVNENEVEDNSPTYDDLLCAFEELHDEMNKLLRKIIF